jgi:hypothetical protein
MKKPNQGGPFHPCGDHDRTQPHDGASLRAWLAGMAIGPLMASDGFEATVMRDPKFNLETDLPRFAAQEAIRIADALIKELENNG